MCVRYLRADIDYNFTIFSVLTMLTGNSFHYIKIFFFYACTSKLVHSKLNFSRNELL